ncbi:MAG: hypothetical protein AAF587_12780 [Bacteroidota bacterium]
MTSPPINNTTTYISLTALRAQLYKRISRGLIPTYLVLSIQSLFKYSDDAGQIWVFTLLLTVPMLVLTIPFLHTSRIEKESLPTAQAKGLKHFITFFLIILFITLIPGEPLAWTIGGIGYLAFFKAMIWPLGLMSALLTGILYFVFFQQVRVRQQVPAFDLQESLSPTIQLQHIPNPQHSILKHTRILISKNEIDRVFNYLQEQTQEHHLLNQLSLLEGNYTNLQAIWNDQRIARSEAQIELNKIVFALLQIAKEIQLHA